MSFLVSCLYGDGCVACFIFICAGFLRPHANDLKTNSMNSNNVRRLAPRNKPINPPTSPKTKVNTFC